MYSRPTQRRIVCPAKCSTRQVVITPDTSKKTSSPTEGQFEGNPAVGYVYPKFTSPKKARRHNRRK